MTQKSTSFDDVAVVTLRGNGYRMNSWFMTKKEAVDKMKNADLILFNVVMSNNTPETITKQQRYRQKCVEKRRRNY